MRKTLMALFVLLPAMAVAQVRSVSVTDSNSVLTASNLMFFTANITALTQALASAGFGQTVTNGLASTNLVTATSNALAAATVGVTNGAFTGAIIFSNTVFGTDTLSWTNGVLRFKNP